MAEIKWIKIITDIFDDEKIVLIEKMPDADAIIVVWFKLLCLAGKTNNDGIMLLNDKIPYTDEMLSIIFRKQLNTVRLALKTFEQFDMIEIMDNVITITNWDKHQSLDGMDKIKEQGRLRKQKERSRKKMLCKNAVSRDSHADVTQGHDTEIDKDKDIDIDNNTCEKAPCQYYDIQTLYSSICKSLPKLTKLSYTRKKAIKARFAAGYTVDDFKSLFVLAESSSFLRGQDSSNWHATFDWLIKDANMAKVLDGNYNDKGGESNGRTIINAVKQSTPKSMPSYDIDEYERQSSNGLYLNELIQTIG